MDKLRKFIHFVQNSNAKYIFGGIFCGLFVGIVAILIASLFIDKDKSTIATVEPATPPPTVAPSETPKPENPEETEPPKQEEPEENLEGKAKSILTGLYIDEDIVNKRPVAVVINNMKKALPQSGLSQADIIYEVLAEGDITRLVAIFQDFNSDKIGPVRSARDYFIDFAFDNDAIFAHHGGSPQGYETIKSSKIPNLDGMELEGTTFWRDKARYSISSMIEHSSYTDASKIEAAIEKKGYRNAIKEDYNSMFEFYNEPQSPSSGEQASEVIVPFSANYTAKFKYNDEEKLYYKFERDNKQIDEETGEQLAVSNIIVQFVKMHIIQGDTYGRRSVSLVSSGEGYIITNGSYAPITWSKGSKFNPTQWFDEDGNKLTLNKGKTWICVYNGDVQFN